MSCDERAPRVGDRWVDLHPELAAEVKDLLRTISVKPEFNKGRVRVPTEDPAWLANQIKLVHLSAFNYSSWWPKMNQVDGDDGKTNGYIPTQGDKGHAHTDPDQPGVKIVPLTAEQRIDLSTLCERAATSGSWTDECLEAQTRLLRLFEPYFNTKVDDLMGGTKSVSRMVRYFVRLDTRSPKDAEGFDEPVTSAKQCLELLTSSDRVAMDLWQFSDAIMDRHRSNAVVFVPWNGAMRQPRAVEFRCFVHRGVLTAISQYIMPTKAKSDEDKPEEHKTKDDRPEQGQKVEEDKSKTKDDKPEQGHKAEDKAKTEDDKLEQGQGAEEDKPETKDDRPEQGHKAEEDKPETKDDKPEQGQGAEEDKTETKDDRPEQGHKAEDGQPTQAEDRDKYIDEAHVDKIRDAILSFWIQVCDAVPYSSCTMDVVVYPDWKVELIEFNPLHEWTETDPCCYDWQRDRALLLGIINQDCPEQAPIRILGHERTRPFIMRHKRTRSF